MPTIKARCWTRWWRHGTLLALLLAPVLFLIVLGICDLWAQGWLKYGSWAFIGCLGLVYLLAWYWDRRGKLIPRLEVPTPTVLTARDEQAKQLIEVHIANRKGITFAQLQDMQFYQKTAWELATDLARVYYPDSDDPTQSVTIVEALRLAEAVAHDLSELVDAFLPGGHLVTIANWRRGKKVTLNVVDGLTVAKNVSLLGSVAFNPLQVPVRFLFQKVASLWLSHKQDELLVMYYGAYARLLGRRLMDLYGRKLTVPLHRIPGAPIAHPALPGDDPVVVSEVTIALLGQVKFGKSSLINAIMGEQKAAVDVLPATSRVERHRLQPAGISSTLVLLDTVGYGHQGPKADQLQSTIEAARQSDLLLLVLHATNPARQADLTLLAELWTWFEERPDLPRPPVIAVLTHVDLLSPAMEWSPPYDWQSPTGAKERTIAEAIAAVRERLEDYLTAVVPVCTAPEKTWGIDEGLLPALTAIFPKAQAIALLRVLQAEADAGKVTKVFGQLWNAGKKLLAGSDAAA